MVNLHCHLWFLLFVKSTLVISTYLKTWLISKNSKALQFSLNRLGYENVSVFSLEIPWIAWGLSHLCSV